MHHFVDNGSEKLLSISLFTVASAMFKNPNVIAYTSRSLSPTEEIYSQIERECLGLVHACERNHIYLFGRQFTVYTDHKAFGPSHQQSK